MHTRHPSNGAHPPAPHGNPFDNQYDHSLLPSPILPWLNQNTPNVSPATGAATQEQSGVPLLDLTSRLASQGCLNMSASSPENVAVRDFAEPYNGVGHAPIIPPIDGCSGDDADVEDDAGWSHGSVGGRASRWH